MLTKLYMWVVNYINNAARRKISSYNIAGIRTRHSFTFTILLVFANIFC